MKDLSLKPDDRVLILGGTGFIGRRLIRELSKRDIKLKLLVRNPSKVPTFMQENKDIEIVRGDLVNNEGLKEALHEIHTAYYLVHSMGGKGIFKKTEFAKLDKLAVENFITSANEEGLKRVIYLGGLGEIGEGLSEHLKSRAEVAEILSTGKPLATILRAAIIIGAGGASFEMLRYLAERLPVMICPRWIDTRIQPIAVKDVLAYLVGCMLNPGTAGKRFDIGGPEILTYREMMQWYCEARGIPRRIIFRVPALTPHLAAYWVNLVTPVSSGIAHPLIEGLKNEVVCLDDSINQYVPINKTPFKEAVKIAISEEKEGPGTTVH
jgi:uncharacterized protein YbjT (DUF2867 family)